MASLDLTRLFEQLTLLLAVGLCGPLLSSIPRLAIPAVIGELLAGVAIGTTGLHLIDASADPLPVFYALGFTMLMLTAGTHVDLQSTTLRAGLIRGVAAFTIVAGLALGVGFGLDAITTLHQPWLLTVLIAGGSAAVAFPIIEERRLRGRDVQFVIAWVAIADSVTVVLMPLTLAGGQSVVSAVLGDVAILAAGGLVLALMLRISRRGLPRKAGTLSVRRSWGLQLRLSILLVFGLSVIASVAGASTLLAGFVAGIVLVRLHKSERLDIEFIGLANGFFVPLFFVLLGARLDLRALFADPHAIVLALAMGLGACAVHVLAALITSPSSPRWAPGLAASAQLGLPAAAASIGLQAHALSPAFASAIVAAGCLSLIPATIGSQFLGRIAEATR